MNGLEVIGGIVISGLLYFIITGLGAVIMTLDDGDSSLGILTGYIIGMALFIVVFMLWMSGKPFPVSLN